MSEAGAIDLSRVRAILDEIDELIDDLDGVELDERTAIEQPPGKARHDRAHQSQTLNLVADRLALAASLVRVEYWAARGHKDPTVDGHQTTHHR
jgi:hypothetical protein